MRSILGTALVAGLVVGVASPALAHEEITPNTVTVGTPTFMTITAANEQKVPLTKLEVKAPDGVSLGLTHAPNGWTAQSDATHATFTGRLAPEHFEQFGFEIEGADQPGAAAFTAVLTFAGAPADTVTIPVTVVAGGSTVATPSAAPSASAPAPSASVTASVTASVEPTASSTPSTAPAAAQLSGPARASTRDNRALAVAIVALLAALAALALAVLRRGPGPAAGAGRAQDW
ncbi:MAG: hypothetical protein QOG49_1292 [Frankiaceae bacterium]|jgi:hypothetical protein|nr:hypothetical protein [Frankiaceae bacterium]